MRYGHGLWVHGLGFRLDSNRARQPGGGLPVFPASERRGNSLEGFKDLNLKAAARTWP